MSFFSKLHFESHAEKITLFVVLVTVISLFLSNILAQYSVFEREKRELIEETRSIAGLIGENSTAAILFNDEKTLNRTLATLEQMKSIIGAQIYDVKGQKRGEYFSNYTHHHNAVAMIQKNTVIKQRGEEQPLISFLKLDYFVISEFIFLDERSIGEVYLFFDVEQFQNDLFSSFFILFISMCLISVFSYVLARQISAALIKPISELQDTANSIIKSSDYSLRVEKYSNDEIGVFTEQFNAMLDEIQARGEGLEKVIEELTQAKEEAENAVEQRDQALFQAITDPLTGLFNRNYFYHEINQHIKASRRYSLPLSLIIVDIDHFKEVNDKYGHLVGDEVLRLVAGKLKGEIRDTDMAIRFGGEEFIIAFVNTSIHEAHTKAEALRISIEKMLIPSLEGKNVTVSIGLSQLIEQDNGINEVISRADDALYQAKNSGRNKLCSS
jgi:diguanylate cyclase (GGDEF)-like protein